MTQFTDGQTVVNAAWLNGVDKAVNQSGTTAGAALISYTPPGTGAVATTVSAKLSQFITPEDFGAVGDGVTDDTSAINQCWAQAASSRVAVWMGHGKTYAFSNLTIPAISGYSASVPGLVIYGNGSTLKKTAAGTYAGFAVASYNWVNNVTSPQAPVHIYDLNIDCNSLATNAGLVIQNYFSRFTNVKVFNCAGSGIYLAGTTRLGSTVAGTQVNNAFIDCWAFSNSYYGFYSDDPTLSINTDSTIEGGFFYDNAHENIYIVNCAGWYFSHVHTYNATVRQLGASCCRFGSTYATRFDGCIFESDASSSGVYLGLYAIEIDGGSDPLAGSFYGCSFYGGVNCVFSSGAKAFHFTGCEFPATSGGNGGYIYHNNNSVGKVVLSVGNTYELSTPIRANALSGNNLAFSRGDFCSALGSSGVYLEGQHYFSQGSGPYVGGYAYKPLSAFSYNATASGGTYSMTINDAPIQFFANPLTAAITIKLPAKAQISPDQSPFQIIRQASATGAFNVVIEDGDTSAVLANITTAGNQYAFRFDGTGWKSIGTSAI